ncbi:MAG TPA: DUF2892 domain-containing protein [Polyangia bacterium]|jgi:hypothetical protein|nr:DUF2892 domain-containing protein [Polyangia bacterium]
MKKNLGTMDRWLRALAALGMLACAALVPLPLAWRVALLGGSAVYLALSALAGTCVAYRLLGRSALGLELATKRDRRHARRHRHAIDAKKE